MKKLQINKGFAAAFIITGIVLLLFPVTMNRISEMQTDSVVKAFVNVTLKDIDEVIENELLAAAEEYNRRLRKGESTALEEYRNLLSPNNDSMMGYIEIPALKQVVPVFHDSEDGMNQGAIHVFGSSLPVGGSGTHSVIAAHTGNENGKFFTDLTKLKEGDTFSVTSLNRECRYVVDDIKVVEPDDTSWLKFKKGYDYCTLLTCTPYGINSHRLLVRGKRMDDVDMEVNASPTSIWLSEKYDRIMPGSSDTIELTGIGLMLLMTFAWLFHGVKQRKGGRDFDEINK